MSKIFISHSSENKELVKMLVEFLQIGMGVNGNDIFCTSLPRSLPTGEAFIEKIKKELKESEAVIFLITEEYLKSLFCITEMGAAWALGKQIYPLLTVKVEKLNRTPLLGLQMRFLNSADDLSVIYDEFCENGITMGRRTAEYNRRLPKFIEDVNRTVKGDCQLKKYGDGYYYTEITKVRKVPSPYRCYRIKGHVDSWTGENEAKSDWLFFREGVYPELKEGDRVKFKIYKTEIRSFPGLGLAKNIYPAELEIIS